MNVNFNVVLGDHGFPFRDFLWFFVFFFFSILPTNQISGNAFDAKRKQKTKQINKQIKQQKKTKKKCGRKKGACPGVEPGTSRTLSENHATRPTGRPRPSMANFKYINITRVSQCLRLENSLYLVTFSSLSTNKWLYFGQFWIFHRVASWALEVRRRVWSEKREQRRWACPPSIEGSSGFTAMGGWKLFLWWVYNSLFLFLFHGKGSLGSNLKLFNRPCHGFRRQLSCVTSTGKRVRNYCDVWESNVE